jgi:site-specific recombinase XerD
MRCRKAGRVVSSHPTLAARAASERKRSGDSSVNRTVCWMFPCEAAKLPFPIHPHMLRHSAGYALAGRGVDTRTLQAFMGHRSISNTVIYTAVADKRLRNIWQKR